MARDEGAGAGSILLAFLPGGGRGGAGAGLYAPATGRETRDFLGDRAREGRERATQAAQRASDFVQQGRETLTSAIDKGREAYQQARAQGPA